MIEIYAVKTKDGIKYNKLNDFISYLSIKKQKRISTYCNYRENNRVIIADLLVRLIICNKLKLKNKELDINTSPYGKPYLKNSESLHYNVSHSGEWVVCAFDSLPIGIDIELIRPIKQYEIVKRFFTSEEYKGLLNREEKDRLSYFYELWTLKESYVKAVGKGLSLKLNSFSINNSPEDYLKISGTDYEELYLKQYNIDSKYKLAVCASTLDFPKNVIIKELDDLFEGISQY
jgi:4'-phosphopantetheinyl transferase